REMARVDDPAVGVEPDDEALGAIGDVDVSRAVDRDALGLPQDRLAAPLRRAAGEQLGAPVDQAIERADSPLAVERRDEQLARAPREASRSKPSPVTYTWAENPAGSSSSAAAGHGASTSASTSKDVLIGRASSRCCGRA